MKDKIKKPYKQSPLWLNALAVFFVPLLFLTTCEWIHRGTLDSDFFNQRLIPHLSAFVLAWMFLTLAYSFLLYVFFSHTVAAACIGIFANVPAIITNLKLEMRGEPFLPWDILQIEDFMGVASKVKLEIHTSVIITAIIFVIVCTALLFVKLPHQKSIKLRLIAGVSLFAVLNVMFYGVFLNKYATEAVGIYSDMWMQDRYYKNHGVITGFLTNLQALQINKPDNYSKEAVEELQAQVQTSAEKHKSVYNTIAKDITEKTPNIIYLMNESFWDVTRLQGFEFDRELTPNLNKLKSEGAYGYCYTPSFGGGTCDVEFEALTGFSVENLPSGAKPYQQHVTQDMFSLPQYLKNEKGYQTLAIHGYYRKFWSRNTAYPRIGIDKFIASEDFINPEKRRGYISDMEMTKSIIENLDNNISSGPMFIHAVTMQNHTTYNINSYTENEIVKIKKSPSGLSQQTLNQLSDFATGVYEADAALGALVNHLRQLDEPVILVFWGDHFNPVGKGYELYEKSGFIEKGAGAASPNLHQTDLLIWSNYAHENVNLGTIASYNISPVMMELYGLEQPTVFKYLSQQLSVIKARTKGITVNPDNSKTEDLSDEQQSALNNHWLLQYDLMFGQPYLNSYVPQ